MNSIELMVCGQDKNEVKLDKDSKIILASFDRSWGEIDSYLPILYKLKQRRPNWNIICNFRTKNLMKTIEYNRSLYNRLIEICDYIFYPQYKTSSVQENESNVKHKTRNVFNKFLIGNKIWKFLSKCKRRIKQIKEFAIVMNHPLFKFVTKDQVKIILKDHDRETITNKVFQMKFSSALKVIYPHGTNPLYTRVNKYKKKLNTKVDLALMGYENDRKYFLERYNDITEDKLYLAGHARYDDWWKNLIIDKEAIKETKEYSFIKGKRCFAFFTRGINEGYSLPQERFEYLCKAVGDIVLKNNNNKLLIAPHPRQNINSLKRIFDNFPKENWMITSLQALEVAFLSDFVISMWSSVILDSLAMKKPTVEFYKYDLLNDNKNWGTIHPDFVELENGDLGSPYQDLEISIFANSKSELKKHIDNYFSNNKSKDLWINQSKKAMDFMNLDNKSAKRAVDAIFESLKR